MKVFESLIDMFWQILKDNHGHEMPEWQTNRRHGKE